ncbi:MAG: protein kinase [Bacteroidota bacterium]
MLPLKLQKEYTLLKEYAQGGQSQTILVSKGDKKYIVKIPNVPSLSKERKFRLEREIKALELMNGFGVPKLYDYSIEDEVYIVMDFIPGLTLNEYVENKYIDLESAVSLVISLCEIVEKAHNIGLFHRDLKPDNIIIEEQSGNPIIIDFGICWLSDDLSFKTRKGIELGNRFLRLPELSKGTDITVSSSDITFLVGILFYLLTKYQPYILLNEDGLQPHKRKDVKDLEVLSNKILKEIFEKGFTYEVFLRYSTAKELKEDLHKIFVPMTNDNIDIDASKRFDEIISSDFYKKKKTNIEVIKNSHQIFLNKYNEKIHESLICGGSGPNVNEKNRTIETMMFLLQNGTTEPMVRFYLNSQFDETFDIITSSYGTENFSGQEYHTIKETTKIENIYPEIAKVVAERTMNELLPKIQAGLK